MAEGLPIYLATIYGKDNVRRFFPMETWKNLKGWEWDRSNQRFITPETKLMKRLGKYDPLVDILAMEHLTLQEELQEEENENEANELKIHEASLLSKIADADENSIISLTKPRLLLKIHTYGSMITSYVSMFKVSCCSNFDYKGRKYLIYGGCASLVCSWSRITVPFRY